MTGMRLKRPLSRGTPNTPTLMYPLWLNIYILPLLAVSVPHMYSPEQVCDLIAARIYTREKPDLYRRLNDAVRETEEVHSPPEEWRSMYYHMLQAVNHLKGAEKNQIVYRGQGERFGEAYDEGDVVTWKAFTSTSTKEDKAKNFAKKGDDPVVFEITGV